MCISLLYYKHKGLINVFFWFRADSSVEIWNLNKTAYLETVLPGHPQGSVEALAWCKSRLFSTGIHARVVEHDLTTLKAKVGSHKAVFTNIFIYFAFLMTSYFPVLCVSDSRSSMVFRSQPPEDISSGKYFFPTPHCLVNSLCQRDKRSQCWMFDSHFYLCRLGLKMATLTSLA